MRAALLAAALLGAAAPLAAQPAWRAVVASEAVDRLAFLRVGADGAVVEREWEAGANPVEPDGPHGVAAAPDGRFVYVTMGHGTPYGQLWKYDAATGAVRGRVTLGDFPATVQVSPDGAWAYVANFNLHGEPVPSSVSIVATGEMVEVARVTTCTMPHGSRFSPDGARHYSTCMMDDALVEIDTRALAVVRHLVLTRGAERGGAGTPPSGAHAGHGHGGHGSAAPAPGSDRCSPTWAEPSPDGRRVWVACNGTSELVEVDAERWTVLRRLPAGPGVYNLAVTRDGRVIATNKRGASVSVFDAATGRELARLPTQRTVVHGAVVTPDDRFALVTVEGVGSQPGTVEVIDLRALRRVSSVDVGPMAGGIAVLGTPIP